MYSRHSRYSKVAPKLQQFLSYKIFGPYFFTAAALSVLRSAVQSKVEL